MSNLPETPSWESGIHQLEEADRAKAGPGGVLNVPATQLANRTRWLKDQIESASDYREYTFYRTELDPDGTIAGLASTPTGKMFRVALGTDDILSFRYYLNDSGIAREVTSLIGLGAITNNIREYASITNAQNDLSSGVILNFSFLWIRNPTDSTLSDEYVNQNGTLEPTGRSVISKEYVDQEVNSKVSELPSGIIKYAAGVQFDEGRVAPFMNSDGRLLYIDEHGEEQLVAPASDVYLSPYMEIPDYVLPDGSVCQRIVIDPENKIVEAWTEDGGYYFATPQGLTRVGEISTAAEQINYASASVSTMFLNYGTTRLSVDNDSRPVMYVLPTWGQSLAQGWSTVTDDTLIATTNLYPENMFMFTSDRGAGKENPNRGAEQINSISPLKETINGGWKETACSSSAAHIINAVESMTGKRINILRYVSADGGKAYRDLTKGSTAWSGLIQGLIDAKRVCESLGYRVQVLGLDAKLGETDTDGTPRMYPEQYTRFLMNLDRNYNAEVKRIFGGDHPDVNIFVEQCSWQPHGPWDSRVRQGQLNADAIGNIRFTGGSYQYPHVGDVIHINSKGQNSRGVQLARAVVFECFGTGFIPIKPYLAYWSGSNTIDVRFLTSVEITKDTSDAVVNQAGLGAGGGFRVRKLAGSRDELTITDVSINSAVNPAIIRITVTNPDAVRDVQIGYALARTGTTTQSGPIEGARGIFRTSAGITNLYTGETEYQWLPAFLMEIN
ncbi:hypothetical protein [Klebsiella quasipneumoniae]|uniref:hypothetical protein n=1 Tax=Klebsiella quasipneumoniae TaxID=1463165 RepID=UPI002147661C|nr:hypothetical protein [Klebsiella quasipneumoniae]MCR1228274.1 hypothetical protein [Klebsiella quasipneumoniae]